MVLRYFLFCRHVSEIIGLQEIQSSQKVKYYSQPSFYNTTPPVKCAKCDFFAYRVFGQQEFNFCLGKTITRQFPLVTNRDHPKNWATEGNSGCTNVYLTARSSSGNAIPIQFDSVIGKVKEAKE